MGFEKNEVRQFPTKEDFMGEKKNNDRVYSYMQSRSYLLQEDNKKVRYCWKTDMSAKKIKEGLDGMMKEEPIKDKNIVVTSLSEYKIRNIVKILEGAGVIKEDKLNNRSIYVLTDLTAGEYVFIKMGTLKYLINTSNGNVIKTYAFLKKKYEMHVKGKFEEPYRFTEDCLLKVLGYDESEGTNHSMIQNILNCLKNNDLIDLHHQPVKVNGDRVVYYYSLDKVNDDYKSIFKKKKGDNSCVPVPVPIEKKGEKKKVMSYEEFASCY